MRPRGGSNRLAAALSDIRNRRYLDAYGGWCAAIVVVVINVVGGFLSGGGFLATLVSSTTILLLGVVALGTAELRRGVFAAVGSSTGKLWRFFSDRSELPPLVERFSGVATRLPKSYGPERLICRRKRLTVLEKGARLRTSLVSKYLVVAALCDFKLQRMLSYCNRDQSINGTVCEVVLAYLN